MLRTAGVIVATAAALVMGAAAAAAAPAPSGSTPSANNSCSNPRLAQSTAGWSMTSGGSGRRVAITGHTSAAYAYRATTTSSTAVMTLPAQAVTAGRTWTFAADSLISSGGRVRVAVDWYSSSYRRLSHVDGATTTVGSAAWVRVPLVVTAPTGAVRAVVTQTAQLTRGAVWSSTACDYSVATSTPPPTTPPTTTTPPPPPPTPDDGTQAATTFGWGTPTGGDEFDGTAVDPAKWYLYDSQGHDGNGLRRPSQIAVANGVMTMSGTSNGTTGGMAAATGYKYGRWETRMRVPAGDDRYHPVLLLWPDAEDWPVGGEVDYAETTAASSDVEFFLHYSAQNQQTSASRAVDLTQWHNYAVEWTPTGIRGYVDGVQFFSDTVASHLPPRSMHQTIQLDWFPSGGTATTPSSLHVAWTRYYPI
jgi:Glycosyl hydrolases family 16